MFCLSVGVRSWDEVYGMVKGYLPLTDLFEIRLDFLEERLDQNKIVGLINTGARLIFTYRLSQEGGMKTIPEEERLSLLKFCLDEGAFLIDVEWQALRRYLKRFHEPPFPLDRVLISRHNFKGCWSVPHLKGYLLRARALGGKWVKLVCLSELPEVGLKLLGLIPYGAKLGLKVISFGMGERLSWTRLTSLFLGAPFTYVSVSQKHQTAAGQLDLQTAKSLYEGLSSCIRSTG